LKISCPNCNAQYKVKDDSVDIGITKLKCKKCEFKFIITQKNIILEVVQPSSQDEEKWIEEANRLAKVIVSDVRIYNKDKINNCKTDEELVFALGPELKKGREYYLSKINPKLKNPNMYYAEAVRKFLKIKGHEGS
jgi:predicted Zn finger-like uncharacterized protein